MPSFNFENEYQGIVFGVDEAGRGPLAGPVVAACVYFKTQEVSYLEDVKDSKKLSAKKREEVYRKILTDENVVSSYGIIDVLKIDEVNIFNATKLAMNEAVRGMEMDADFVLVDGNHKMIEHRGAIPVVKGDDKSYSIAAASIIAKTVRDKIMVQISEEFPDYLWGKNAGYGTKEHREAIVKHGITVHHRRSFKLVA
jgi:ribonuclease HII